MKHCPICKTQYSDDAEFCAKCKALLQSDENAQAKHIEEPTDYKKLIVSIGSTLAFMLVVAFFIWLITKI